MDINAVLINAALCKFLINAQIPQVFLTICSQLFSIKKHVALYVGIPGQQPATLPRTAAEVLKEKAALSEDQLAKLEQYTADLN